MSRYIRVMTSAILIALLFMGMISCGGVAEKRENDQSQEPKSGQMESSTDDPKPSSSSAVSASAFSNFAELIEMDGATLKKAMEGFPVREGNNVHVFASKESVFNGSNNNEINPDGIEVGDWFITFVDCDGTIVSPWDYSHATDEMRATYASLGCDYSTDLCLVGPSNTSAEELAALIDGVYPIALGGIAFAQDGSFEAECKASTGGVFLSNQYDEVGTHRVYHLKLMDALTAQKFFHGEIAGDRLGKTFYGDFGMWKYILSKRIDAGEKIDLYTCGEGGSSSAAKSASSATASSSLASSESSPSSNAANYESAEQSASETIDLRYVGEWTGYDVYTMQDVKNTYNLHDNGDWATLVVNADGSASFEGKVADSSLALSNMRLELGEKQYRVYDEGGDLVGSLGYERSGTTDWLILSVPEEEVGMVCYTFFINNRA